MDRVIDAAEARVTVFLDNNRGGGNFDAEVGVLLLSLVWALVLLSPATTFTSSPGYRLMRFLPESVWGGLFLVHFVAGGVGLARRLGRLRRGAMLAGVVMWSTVTAMLTGSNPAGTGWVYAVAAAGAALGFLRLGVEARDGT